MFFRARAQRLSNILFLVCYLFKKSSVIMLFRLKIRAIQYHMSLTRQWDSHTDPRHSFINRQRTLKSYSRSPFPKGPCTKGMRSLDRVCFENDSPNSVIPRAIVEDAYITAMSLGVSLARCSVVIRCIFPHGCCSDTELCPVLPEVMS